jgi:methylated-DNA-[protein]-cysteine S-methyltransferase
VKALKPKQTKGAERNGAICCSKFKTPIGDLLLVAEADALTGVYFAGCDHVPSSREAWTADPNHPVIKTTVKQLGEYFAGKRNSFSLPLRLTGSAFQERIWQQIALVPYGKTISYTELAKRAGAPEAVRAAGATTGRNPLSIIVPCHRIVGKNGKLCGFAGGLEKKQFLLKLEASNISSH